MSDADKLQVLVVEALRCRSIYRKALDEIDKYGDLINMQATARKAISDACQPVGEADTKEPEIKKSGCKWFEEPDFCLREHESVQ